MKIFKNISLKTVTALIVCLIIFGCKKDNIDNVNLADEVAIGLSAYTTIPSLTGIVLASGQTPAYQVITNDGFQALLHESHATDVHVTAKINTDSNLVKIYDSLYHASSAILPVGLFKLANNGLISVKAGETSSQDSIKLQFADLSAIDPGQYNLVIPIEMESDVEGALKSKIMFMRYKLTITSITLDGLGTSKTGGTKTYKADYLNRPADPEPLYIQMSLVQTIANSIKLNVEGISSQEFVSAYNAKYGTNYLPLPEGAWSFPVSTPQFRYNTTSPLTYGTVTLDFSKFPTPDFESYLLAIKLKNADNSTSSVDDILASDNVLYYIPTNAHD